ncbi:hypothetical protein F511_28086 [Dorcoceras hygrometricum]|uniref:Uncharacterized protein n=1 Tax=Dorcoceras hygrometricum TaxID=472368 RepID=A0A2Z7A686_9LAMI|nr:hypothetical protein F511_28086 [Dorcoceras hygrometricum]
MRAKDRPACGQRAQHRALSSANGPVVVRERGAWTRPASRGQRASRAPHVRERYPKTMALIPLLGSGSRPPARQRKNEKHVPGHDQYDIKQNNSMTFIGCFKGIPCWKLVPGYNRNYKNAGSSRTCVTLNGSGIQLAVGPQPLWLRNHNPGLAHRIMYGPFNPYIPIRSTTIGKSRVAIDPITMRTSWRSNSDIASVTSIGYPRMSASGESSTTMHRLLHASGSHPIPTPYDPKTNQYNQDLGLIDSTNGNHLESPNEGSSIDPQEGFTRRFDVCRPSTNTRSLSLAQSELLTIPQTITQTQLLVLHHLE